MFCKYFLTFVTSTWNNPRCFKWSWRICSCKSKWNGCTSCAMLNFSLQISLPQKTRSSIGETFMCFIFTPCLITRMVPLCLAEIEPSEETGLVSSCSWWRAAVTVMMLCLGLFSLSCKHVHTHKAAKQSLYCLGKNRLLPRRQVGQRMLEDGGGWKLVRMRGLTALLSEKLYDDTLASAGWMGVFLHVYSTHVIYI